MIDCALIGKRIAEVRAMRGLSRAALGKKVGVTGSTVSRYESGDIRNITNVMIGRLAEALQCAPAYLMGWSEDMDGTGNAKPANAPPSIMDKYSALDKLGRHAVDTILDTEYERVMDLQNRQVVSPVRPISFIQLPVSAGTGIDLDADNSAEPIYVPLDETSWRADFVLRVAGDSMEPLYQDGDLILVRKMDSVAIGELGVFGINGNGYFKKLELGELVSLNPEYGPIILEPDDDITVFGRVIGKTRMV